MYTLAARHWTIHHNLEYVTQVAALQHEVQSLQQALQAKGQELSHAQQYDHALLTQTEAAHQDLAQKLTWAQHSLQVGIAPAGGQYLSSCCITK